MTPGRGGTPRTPFGALVLAAAFASAAPCGPGRALYLGVFHAVSAFCNAGFDLFGRSLTDCVGNAAVNLAVMSLIVIGGLGFVVLEELMTAAAERVSP